MKKKCPRCSVTRDIHPHFIGRYGRETLYCSSCRNYMAERKAKSKFNLTEFTPNRKKYKWKNQGEMETGEDFIKYLESKVDKNDYYIGHENSYGTITDGYE